MKRFLCAVVCVFLLASLSGCEVYEDQPTQKHSYVQKTYVTEVTDEEIYVYITETGSKYHEYYCGSLWNSCIEVSLQYATRNGYTPCNRCQPPC